MATVTSGGAPAARPGRGEQTDRRLRLAGDAGSLREARHMVGGALADVDDETRDTAVLLADEVITNAVVHGGGWFLVEVERTPRRIRVEVTDASATQPRVMRPNGAREHGRGVAIVDRLASAWGTDHLGTHKTVWFELVLPG